MIVRLGMKILGPGTWLSGLTLALLNPNSIEPPPLVYNTQQLGISAPQGCGKTTLVEQLEMLFHWKGLRAASVSIDDFYLTYNVRDLPLRMLN